MASAPSGDHRLVPEAIKSCLSRICRGLQFVERKAIRPYFTPSGAAMMAAVAVADLTVTEALALVPESGIGRLAICVDALPVVISVRYRCTAAGVMFDPPADVPDRSLYGHVLCFEYTADALPGEGWSLNVIGIGRPAGDGRMLVPFTLMRARRF